MTAKTYGSLSSALAPVEAAAASASFCCASASSSFVASSSAASIICNTYSGDDAFINFSRTFSSIKMPDNFANASKCV